MSPEPSSSPESSGEQGRQPRTLVVPSPKLSRSLLQLDGLSSIAASGRAMGVLATEAQMAVLDPSLVKWRLDRHPPESLALPVSLERASTDAAVLRRYDFEEAVFLAGASSAAALAARAGIPVRRGFGGLAAWRLTHKDAEPKTGHVTTTAKPLLEAMGVPWSPRPLHISDTWRRTGLDRLRSAKLDPGDGRLIGVYVGNSGSLQGGLWPTERFEELIRRLRGPKRHLVILSSDSDLWQTVLLHERTDKRHPVIGPDLHFDGLAATLSHLDLVVSGDSAMLQLAAAVGTTTLGLFRRGADRFAPLGDRHHVIEQPPKSLALETVFERCEQILDGFPDQDS